jgi:hypothetical protein
MSVENLADQDRKVKSTTNQPPSRRAWLEQAASAVRWLRKDSKPSPDEPDERFAEDRLWDAANTTAAATEIVPRQCLVIAHAEFGGSVRILEGNERAFVVELPEGGVL